MDMHIDQPGARFSPIALAEGRDQLLDGFYRRELIAPMMLFEYRTADGQWHDQSHPEKPPASLTDVKQVVALAIFDRQETEAGAFNDQHTEPVALNLWLCRTLSAQQPLPARFFFVVNGHDLPWSFIELDTITGAIIHRETLREDTAQSRQALWSALGLRPMMGQHFRPSMVDET